MAAGQELVARPRHGTELTHRLVSVESMAKGLEDFMAGLRRCTVLIKQASFSWGSGQFQPTNIVLYEDTKLVDDGKIDARLVNARQVVLLAIAPDGGTAKIDLTARDVEILAGTSGIYKLLNSFNAQLLRGAKSRWFSPGSSFALIAIPGLIIAALFFIDTAVNPALRDAVYDNGSTNSLANTSRRLPLDRWAVHAMVGMLPLWLISIIAAVFCGIVVVWSGPLRMWPKSLSTRSLLLMMYQMRESGSLSKNLLFIIVTITSAILGGIVTAIISK